jgi:gliding motility-associated-like protein
VKVVDKTTVYVPNAFSPNKDGKNDLLKPIIRGYLATYRFTVYNRWGGQVFDSADPQKGWDGTLNGTPVDSGVFVWVLTGKDLLGVSFSQKGAVVLIR